MKFNQALKMALSALRANLGVITSYSIHYTKLYDFMIFGMIRGIFAKKYEQL